MRGEDQVREIVCVCAWVWEGEGGRVSVVMWEGEEGRVFMWVWEGEEGRVFMWVWEAEEGRLRGCGRETCMLESRVESKFLCPYGHN